MAPLKLKFILLITVLGLFSFSSCDDDGYSLGDFTVALATVKPIDAQAGSYYLILDNGTTLWPAASAVNYKPKDKQRVIVDYTLLSDQIGEYDHYAKINALREILTKEIVDLTSQNEEEIGNDPVKILDLWTGDNYLNIHFGYNVGGSTIHTINLVQNKLDQNAETETQDPLILEFRHNMNGDTEKYGVKQYAAFDLRPFQIAGQNSINIVIKVKDFQGQEKEFPITYKYEKAAKPAQKLNNITMIPEHSSIIR